MNVNIRNKFEVIELIITPKSDKSEPIFWILFIELILPSFSTVDSVTKNCELLVVVGAGFLYACLVPIQ